jgi:hypothetical protein
MLVCRRRGPASASADLGTARRVTVRSIRVLAQSSRPRLRHLPCVSSGAGLVSSDLRSPSWRPTAFTNALTRCEASRAPIPGLSCSKRLAQQLCPSSKWHPIGCRRLELRRSRCSPRSVGEAMQSAVVFTRSQIRLPLPPAVGPGSTRHCSRSRKVILRAFVQDEP